MVLGAVKGRAQARAARGFIPHRVAAARNQTNQLTAPRQGCPSGVRFLVNGHDVDLRRNYSVASTRRAGVDNATEGELEHEIARSEA